MQPRRCSANKSFGGGGNYLQIHFVLAWNGRISSIGIRSGLAIRVFCSENLKLKICITYLYIGTADIVHFQMVKKISDISENSFIPFDSILSVGGFEFEIPPLFNHG